MMALIKALAEDEDSLVRNRAAVALASFRDTAQTVPALNKALNDGDGQVRQAATESLGKLGQ
jgi:HEAT repeat protein